jgi:outer membrane lipoprotein SlyB
MKTLASFCLASLLGLSLAVTAAPPEGQVVPSGKCADCGTVTNIENVNRKGDASGKGAVIGAVVGGVVGHQVGSGRGNDAATAAGAVGGAVAGNEIEKNRNADQVSRVTVEMDNGGTRQIDVQTLNGLTTGARVKISGNNLQPIS